MSKSQQELLKYYSNGYLIGWDIDSIQLQLQMTSTTAGQSAQSLFKAIEISSDDHYIQALFNILNIKDQSYIDRYLQANNFYELLTNLCYDDHHHLAYLLKLIDETRPPRNWALIFSIGATISAALGLIFYFKKNYFELLLDWFAQSVPSALHWLGKTFSLLRNIPILGIIYNSIGLAMNWHMVISRGHPDHIKLSHLFFKSLQSTLTIAAYTLTYLAGGTLAFPIAMLFVLSASMDVFKSLANLHYSKKALKSLSEPDINDSWERHAEYERVNNYLQQASQSVWLQLGGALLTTMASCICSFSPPNPIVYISYFTFITLVSFAQTSFSSLIERQFANSLQKCLSLEISQSLDPNIAPDPYTSKALTLLQERQVELNRREEELNQREARLQSFSEGISATLQAVSKGHRTIPRAEEQIRRSACGSHLFFSSPPSDHASLATSQTASSQATIDASLSCPEETNHTSLRRSRSLPNIGRSFQSPSVSF